MLTIPARNVDPTDQLVDEHGCRVPVLDVYGDATHGETVIVYRGCSLEPGQHVWTLPDSAQVDVI